MFQAVWATKHSLKRVRAIGPGEYPTGFKASHSQNRQINKLLGDHEQKVAGKQSATKANRV